MEQDGCKLSRRGIAMHAELIAPCGMNCSLCSAYQLRQNGINKRGFNKKHCPGCLPRGENCTHMGDTPANCWEKAASGFVLNAKASPAGD